MPYKYHLDDDKEADYEACKANPDHDLQDDWPENYIDAIKQNLSRNKILLIPSDWRVLALLKNEGIQYTLCYPKRDAKEIYHNRFITRGNTEVFIDIFIGGWDGFINSLESDRYGHHIVLESDQYLSDVIDVKAYLAEV